MKEKTDRLFIILLYLWLASLPFTKAGSSILIVVLFAVSVYRLTRTGLTKENSLKFFVASALFWLYASSLLWSDDLFNGLDFLKSQLFLVVVPFVVMINQAVISERLRSIINVYLGAICTAWLLTIVFNLIPPPVMEKWSAAERLFQPYALSNSKLFGLYSPFITRIQLSNFLATGFFISLFAIWKYRKPGYLVSIILCLTGIIFLGGRGGQLGWFFALCLLLILFTSGYGKSLPAKIGLSILSLGIMVAIGYFTLYHVEPVKSRYAQHRYEEEMFRSGEYKNADYQHFTSIRRWVSWQNSLKLVGAQPYLGTGIGDYATKFEQAYAEDKYDLPANNHSQYLHIAGCIGGAGLLLWLLSIFAWLSYAGRKRYRATGYFGIACIVVYLVAFIPDALLLKQVDIAHFAWLYSFWLWIDP